MDSRGLSVIQRLIQTHLYFCAYLERPTRDNSVPSTLVFARILPISLRDFSVSRRTY